MIQLDQRILEVKPTQIVPFPDQLDLLQVRESPPKFVVLIFRFNAIRFTSVCRIINCFHEHDGGICEGELIGHARMSDGTWVHVFDGGVVKI